MTGDMLLEVVKGAAADCLTNRGHWPPTVLGLGGEHLAVVALPPWGDDTEAAVKVVGLALARAVGGPHVVFTAAAMTSKGPPGVDLDSLPHPRNNPWHGEALVVMEAMGGHVRSHQAGFVRVDDEIVIEPWRQMTGAVGPTYETLASLSSTVDDLDDDEMKVLLAEAVRLGFGKIRVWDLREDR